MSENDRKQMLGTEQKSIELMKDFVQKVLKPADLVLDAFAGTLSTANLCKLLEMHRSFVGCEKDNGCVNKSMEALV